jgi:hypothetical protein
VNVGSFVLLIWLATIAWDRQYQIIVIERATVFDQWDAFGLPKPQPIGVVEAGTLLPVLNQVEVPLMSLTPQLASAASRRDHLVKICKSLPEVTIKAAGEHLGIRIRKKTLAWYQFDHHGDGMISLVCKSNLSDQRRRIKADPETFFVPDYLGVKGWIGIRLDLVEVDWAAVNEILRSAYQVLAPRKLAALVE